MPPVTPPTGYENLETKYSVQCTPIEENPQAQIYALALSIDLNKQPEEERNIIMTRYLEAWIKTMNDPEKNGKCQVSTETSFENGIFSVLNKVTVYVKN